MMVVLALAALILGMIAGLFLPDFSLLDFISEHTQIVLYLLMCSVGISVSQNKAVFRNIRIYHVKIFLIPLGIVLGTLVGGAVYALLSGTDMGESLAVVSGLGWYSLSGILVAELYTAQLGSIAFLSNLMREMLSFCLIPVLARRLNFYTAIAPAAATSEDTTLPMLVRYTSEEVVVMAVFNGVICSALVPVLIRFCYHVF